MARRKQTQMSGKLIQQAAIKAAKATMTVEEATHSVFKMFGERADSVLAKMYNGEELKQALEVLGTLKLNAQFQANDAVGVEDTLEMQVIEPKGDNPSTDVMDHEEKFVPVENQGGIDALEDKREIEHEAGTDAGEETFESWTKTAQTEDLEPVEFKELYRKLEDGTHTARVGHVSRFFSQNTQEFKVVVNVHLPPFYSKAEHRGYVVGRCATYYTLTQFRELCEKHGWDYNNLKVPQDTPATVVIYTDKAKHEKRYFVRFD